jgi:hypothetical protein
MRAISGVSESSDAVSGIFDIVAKLHSDPHDWINSIIKKFHLFGHVRWCSTMIVAAELNNWESKYLRGLKEVTRGR